MVYSDASIAIHLINGRSSSTDDMILIRKDLSLDEFEVTYKEYNDGDPIVHTVNGLYRSRLIDYLYMVIKNQSLDEESYESIQLTLPAMPRIIVSGDKFKDLYYREHFLELIGTSIDLFENVAVKKKVPSVHRSSWAYQTPVSGRSTAPGVRPQHLYFDDAV